MCTESIETIVKHQERKEEKERGSFKIVCIDSAALCIQNMCLLQLL